MGKNGKKVKQLEDEIGKLHKKVNTAITTLVAVNQRRRELKEEVEELKQEMEELKNVARIQGKRISVLEEASAVQLIGE